MRRLLGLLWRNRELLGPIAKHIETLAEQGFSASEIRAKLADGIQREDFVSTDALEVVRAARRRAATGYKRRAK